MENPQTSTGVWLRSTMTELIFTVRLWGIYKKKRKKDKREARGILPSLRAVVHQGSLLN